MKLKFTVTGMTCAACSARVEKVTGGVNGVENVEVNLLAGKMTVTAKDPSVADTIVKAVQNAGYGATLQGNQTPSQQPTKTDDTLKEMKIRIIGSAIFLSILMYLPWDIWWVFPCQRGTTDRRMRWWRHWCSFC